MIIITVKSETLQRPSHSFRGFLVITLDLCSQYNSHTVCKYNMFSMQEMCVGFINCLNYTICSSWCLFNVFRAEIYYFVAL